MTWLPILVLAVLVISLQVMQYDESFAQEDDKKFFESVKFIQYLDENTALEEVKNGNLDTYYYTISPDRLENDQGRGDLQVFDSTGGSFSILVNPAEAEKFNPFSSRDIRFAMNYLVDRKLIVNELMGGYGAPIVSYYGPSDPEYLTVIEQLETFSFKYNPALAEKVISEVLTEKGAVRDGDENRWQINGEDIEIRMFIRSDDHVRKSIGEILAVELERMGFAVKKDFGDLNKAFVVVYGSDPADLKWSLYTEGWGRSAFVRYDSAGLGQMYAPWFSNMPGSNDPSYWNYSNEKLDTLTQKIYTSDFETSEQRTELIQEAVVEGVNESVRIFLASTVDQYVVNQNVEGVVNDFGAGVPSRFTAINARGDHEEFAVGVKHIYQGAWNPVMGLTDVYSNHIWGIISDPATFKHPFTGEALPVRATWEVETAGPSGKLDIPEGTTIWNPSQQRWDDVGGGNATSKVTFDLKFSNWHNGEEMNMQDILYALYFVMEWGTQTDANDRTFDAEFTPRASQSIQTIRGVNLIDEDTIEVYVDYWHFDQGEIAEWAAMWSSVPWEITAAMESAVIDGKVSFSRSGATSKNVNWLSLIVPNDSQIIKEYLQEFKDTDHIPQPLQGSGSQDTGYYQDRYDASIKWIEDKDHAVISNGPFYLELYSPESRTITVKAFDDSTYPFKKGEWSAFEKTEFPTISSVRVGDIVKRGDALSILVETENSDSVWYFLTNTQGEVIASETVKISDAGMTDVTAAAATTKSAVTATSINIPPEITENLGIGVNNIKIFVVSDSVLKPDFYESSFIATSGSAQLPESTQNNAQVSEEQSGDGILTALVIIIVIGIPVGIAAAVLYRKKKKQAL